MGIDSYALAMLGEQHDIDHEFPEYHEKLEALRTHDEKFDAIVSQHDELDSLIRRLEERQQPTSDEEMEKMKYQRAALKDRIYKHLRS
jgi:uncharacterized protein YdcH (DUF465 family)